ncbi:PREDICTED: uncharacterized protein LOC104610822 isoform X2 [Nelumbo nucifera]|uniref:Uncharacterized protein LOC104610822 isoform X2 n=1 Tax=Nelumbo nucifera TaxID=4432 RepID=A0A1U8B4Z2_NELNU|nr:PREDICTED: uncharacterized protein LOC104610822 isoform X2 [Nelumbo nucifera]
MSGFEYQRSSIDCLPLSNGRKPHVRTCKEDDSDGVETGRIASYNNLEGKPLRFRSTTNPEQNSPHFAASASSSPQSENHGHQKSQSHERSPSPSPSRGGGDVILQWGQNKRSRGARSEARVMSDELSARQVIKIPRRVGLGVQKQSPTHNTGAMPPPPPPGSGGGSSYNRGANLRPPMPVIRESTGSLRSSRSLEDRPAAGNGSPARSNGGSTNRKRSPRSPSSPDKAPSCYSTIAVGDKRNGCLPQAELMINHVRSTPADEEATATPAAAGVGGGGGGEKVNLDHFEWPRIYISLSRKEKEDDFYAMKGTKLPQRPKKRAKALDKTLQYVFPGMWLSDLTRGRYEVREKKCVKKQKRRGLKGMESLDSDSE